MPSKRVAANRLAVSDEVLEQLHARLRRVEGQMRGIQRMLDERKPCHDVLQQMSAARAAIERTMVTLMVESLAQCLQPADNRRVDPAELRRLSESFVKML